jgi:hypothetical protein
MSAMYESKPNMARATQVQTPQDRRDHFFPLFGRFSDQRSALIRFFGMTSRQ